MKTGQQFAEVRGKKIVSWFFGLTEFNVDFLLVVIVYLLPSFVLNTCVNMPHQDAVNRVILRRVLSEDQMPMAVTSCIDGNFKLWSLSVNTEVSGQFQSEYVMTVCVCVHVNCVCVWGGGM